MMHRNKTMSWVIAVASVTAFIALRCADLGPLAGTVTQSGNGIVSGMVVDSGAPVTGARVLLVPARYDPYSNASLPDLLIDTTDESGAFSILAPRLNDYNVEVEHVSGKNTLLCGVSFQTGDTQSTGLLRLALPGSIKVIISDTIDAGTAYVYIPGTTFFSLVHDDTALLENIPAGSILELSYHPAAAEAKDRIIKTNIMVTSGETTSIADYSTWKQSKRLYLNTTASGAGVAGNVTDFPALVRLTSNNFDFSQARPGGEDARFTKVDGTPLAFEIERWDPVTELAEVWVKVDTVYGNDDSHCFIIYWGNSNAAGISSAESVFDTADGFIGVWHLAGAGTAQAADATPHHYDGTPTDTAPQATPGVIGSALQFDGKSSGLLMKNTAAGPLNFPRPGTYTFSAWVSVDSVYDEDEFIAGKGHDQYALRVKGEQSIPANMFALHEYIDAPVYGTDMRYAPVVTRQWKYMVGIRDTAASYLYIDGTCVDSIGMVFSVRISSQDSTNFSIGRCGAPYNGDNYLPFKGKIDEVRIADVACTADWVKLCYMNQKAGDMLVKFAK
jgi:hypothetical protein